MRHRSRELAVTAVTAALLSALAGCSEGAAPPPASPASLASGSARPVTPAPAASAPPAPTSAAPTSTAPSAECADTGAMAPEKLATYLARLKSSSGSYGSKALKIDGAGLSFAPDPTERPCAPVKVALSRFWVDVSRGGTTPGSSRPSPGQEFRYVFMDRPVLTVGPTDGIVEGSVPPQSSACRGSLSVVHVGADITEADLPSDLEMPTSYTAAGRGAMDVKVTSDRVLAATFVPPSAPGGC
ncbi:hypothetical protein OOK31_00770 [Streptomyces sp. NBC_00249]|uniref:hypothetical protein n=1 Tax=Streptomyces sp. NBC_00249 TaxID=2975690 RepID=UPI00225385AB|nr:hypothetical protein [Streptomyces sp. NBC_00249]MCX5192432.1 hypothetical protein [Streptomyces sp. NBC_00249]